MLGERASSEERRKRLDLLIDEASMLSFPASDPPAVFLEEPEPIRREASATQASPEESTGEGGSAQGHAAEG